MSLVFDQDKQFNYIYRYISGSFETTNYASAKSWDLFPDDAGVGDCIYFGRYNPSWSFHDLTFNIGTALSATGITIVWEYRKQSTAWTAIPSVTDGTNHFQNTGINTVAFDVPEKMAASSSSWYTYLTIDGSRKYGYYVRCRITSVSGITEGGSTKTDTVKFKDFTITAGNESLTCAILQSASDSGSWYARSGVKAVETMGKHTMIRPHLYFSGSTSFTETLKMIELGEENYPAGWRNLGTGVVKLGEEDASGKGTNGCYVYMHTRFDSGYDYVFYVQSYASVIYRRTGRYGAFAMGKVFKFVDSVFISADRWYLPSYVSAGSEWARSVYADNDLLYLYSPNLAIDTFKSLDAWQGLLCGGTATISNTDINNKKLMRYYSSQMTLIDCINIDYSKITSTSPSAGADRHVRIKYNIDIHIIDKDNNDVQGASVVLTDVNGAETFNVVTGSDGKIATQLVMVYDKWWEYAASWSLHEDDYNDFSLVARYAGRSYRMGKFTISTPIDWTLQLQKTSADIIIIDQETI